MPESKSLKSKISFSIWSMTPDFAKEIKFLLGLHCFDWFWCIIFLVPPFVLIYIKQLCRAENRLCRWHPCRIPCDTSVDVIYITHSKVDNSVREQCCQNFPKTACNWKNLGPGGAHPKFDCVDPPLAFVVLLGSKSSTKKCKYLFQIVALLANKPM